MAGGGVEAADDDVDDDVDKTPAEKCEIVLSIYRWKDTHLFA